MPNKIDSELKARAVRLATEHLLVKLSTAVKAGMRALLAKHNIRLAATQLDSDSLPV